MSIEKASERRKILEAFYHAPKEPSLRINRANIENEEDITQETFFKALKNADSFRERHHAAPYDQNISLFYHKYFFVSTYINNIIIVIHVSCRSWCFWALPKRSLLQSAFQWMTLP